MIIYENVFPKRVKLVLLFLRSQLSTKVKCRHSCTCCCLPCLPAAARGRGETKNALLPPHWQPLGSFLPSFERSSYHGEPSAESYVNSIWLQALAWRLIKPLIMTKKISRATCGMHWVQHFTQGQHNSLVLRALKVPITFHHRDLGQASPPPRVIPSKANKQQVENGLHLTVL